MNSRYEIAVFANGCFWCTEATFAMLKGVNSVTPGYTGGKTSNPTYESVSAGNTGHAEALKIEYDPSIISYDDLLTVFFFSHDPTTLNRQGADVGTQYRSVIFYADATQRTKAEQFIAHLTANHAYTAPIVTEVVPFTNFYEAEDYHKNYYQTHESAPYCQIVIAPKLEKLQKQFENLIK